MDLNHEKRREIAKTIYLCPSWPGYWEQVHGFRNPPNWVEFSCHEKRPPDEAAPQALFDTGFLQVDMANMTNLRGEAAYKIVGRDAAAQSQFAQQVRRLKSGESDYFVIVRTGRQYVIGQIPDGRTLFDYPEVRTPMERYVFLFVREEYPLLPVVVCQWMNRLSPALFGFPASCFVPRNQRWSKEKTKEFFGYTEP